MTNTCLVYIDDWNLNRNQIQIGHLQSGNQTHHQVVERHTEASGFGGGGVVDKFPPILVDISCDEENVVLRISDQGGGIPPRIRDHIWSYLYSTAPSMDAMFEMKTPIAGYGIGLPLSRAYMKWVGGNIELSSMNGLGTDVYVTMNRLGNAEEAVLHPTAWYRYR